MRTFYCFKRILLSSLLIGLLNIVQAQIKWLKTITYEKEIYVFPDVEEINEYTPVLLCDPIKAEPLRIMTIKEAEEEETKPRPPLPLQTYYLRPKPGVLWPVKIAGDILHYNAREIIAWDYQQLILSKYTAANGRISLSRSIKLAPAQGENYMRDITWPDGDILFTNQVYSAEKRGTIERIDFYDSTFTLVNTYPTVLQADAEVTWINKDSLIIVELGNSEKGVHLSLFSLQKGLLKDTTFPTDLKVSSLFSSVTTDKVGKVLVAYQAYDTDMAQLLIFTPNFTLENKITLSGALESIQPITDSLLIVSFSRSIVDGGTQYMKLAYSPTDLTQGTTMQDLFKKSLPNREDLRPFQERLLNDTTLIYLNVYYSAKQEAQGRRLVVMHAGHTYTLNLGPITGDKEFVTVPLRGRKLGVYKGRQVKLYSY